MPRQLQTDDATFEVRETDLDEITDPDPDVVYICQELTTRRWRELNRQYTKRVPNKLTRRMDEQLDSEAFADALVDFVVQDWRGIVEPGGAAAPCTRENKLRLDGAIKSALIGRAGLTQIVREPEDRAQSFRSPAAVGGVLDR